MLDHRSHIFQNLNGVEDEVELHVLSNESYAINTLYNTRSAVYHGNGASKVNRWIDGCMDRLTDRWIEGCLDGLTDRWMEG